MGMAESLPVPDPATPDPVITEPVLPQSVPQSPRPLLTPKLKKIIGIALGIFLGFIIVGFVYRLTRPPAELAEPADSADNAIPDPSPTSAATKDLRLGVLTVPHPSNWLVLFSPIVDAKTPDLTPLYFARSQEEYRQHASCAATGSCTTAPLSISFTGSTIWTGYSLENFIRVTAPEYPLDKMSETVFAGRPGLGGITDLGGLTYQAVVLTSDNTYQSLVITSREDTKDMLGVMIDSLQKLTLQGEQVASPANLSVQKNTFTLKLTARLHTTEYPILDLVLTNLLEPSLDSLNPAYFLYTETPNSFAPGNYLDFTYYLLTDNPDLASGNYTTAQVTGLLSPPPKDDFAPYLLDAKYCRQSEDCVYRAESCTFDSYNRYTRFAAPRSCANPEYLGLGSRQELKSSLRCNQDEGIEITYDSLECIENKCVARNPVPACEDN